MLSRDNNIIKIDKQSVLAQERGNNGSLIYLYKDEPMDTWVAFGYSAYVLRLFCKRRQLDNLRGYSAMMGLPCTIIPHAVIGIVRKELHIAHEEVGISVKFKLEEACNMADYVEWMGRLTKERDTNQGSIEVKTLVSQEVPKDVYIADNMSSFSRNMKRIIDLCISTGTLIVFSPIMLIVHIAIKMEDHGPSIYKQERIGRFGRPFNIYKFRSMRMDSEKFGPQLSHAGGDNDPRLTKVGKFIRAHHLDELPQLWNVFCGDMSFIGYRPERQFFIDQILEYDYRYTYLYQIRPGVTSYATLYNGYTDTMEKMLKRLEYDLYYLQHRSFWFDMKVLWNTFSSIAFGKKF